MPRRPKPSDYIRTRLREELTRAQVSGAELARRLTEHTGQPWSGTKVSKLLLGYNEDLIFRVDDLVAICEVAGLSLVEIVRDAERTIADLTPDELRILRVLRQNPARLKNLAALFPDDRPPSANPARARLRMRR
jgi:transcriptional regulator with XRE-family HTH domain